MMLSTERIRVIAAVVRQDDKYLVCKRPLGKRHGGLWEFPGGKIKTGETLREAAQRELNEELNVTVVGVGARLYTADDPGALFSIEFVAVDISGQPESIEHRDIRWCALREMVDMEFAPADATFVNRCLKQEKTIDPHMHTAEHILNQAMGRLFGTKRCFSAHIEKKKSKCDYHFDRPLTDEEVRCLTAEVNKVIQADLVVTEQFQSPAEAGELYNLDKLPDQTVDTVRIIKIGDYDACPCIGGHAPSTGRIGLFRITTTDFAKGVLRIRFKLDRQE